MKFTLAMLGSGMLATLTGLLVQSCNAPDALALGAWCGHPPSFIGQNASFGHCEGCVLLVAGLALTTIGVVLSLKEAVQTTPAELRGK